MPMNFTLRQLEYLDAVARHGSITAAAAARNVSQPSVSVALTELEGALGRMLFRRGAGQKLAITPAGRRLLVQARVILAAAERIAGAEPDAPGGEIALASFRDLGPTYLPRLMSAFATRDPECRFVLAECDLAEVRNRLLDGRSELAITYDIDLRAHGIARRVIDRLDPYVLLPAAHPLAAMDRVPLDALAAERLVIEEFPVTYDYFIDLYHRHGIIPHAIQRVPSFELQRGLVARGWGVGLSCVRPKPDFSHDGTPLACRPLAGPEPAQKVVIAHLGEATLSAAALRFLQAAAVMPE